MGKNSEKKKKERKHLYWIAERERKERINAGTVRTADIKQSWKLKLQLKNSNNSGGISNNSSSNSNDNKNITRNIRTLAAAWCFQFTWWFSHFRFLFRPVQVLRCIFFFSFAVCFSSFVCFIRKFLTSLRFLVFIPLELLSIVNFRAKCTPCMFSINNSLVSVSKHFLSKRNRLSLFEIGQRFKYTPVILKIDARTPFTVCTYLCLCCRHRKNCEAVSYRFTIFKLNLTIAFVIHSQ